MMKLSSDSEMDDEQKFQPERSLSTRAPSSSQGSTSESPGELYSSPSTPSTGNGASIAGPSSQKIQPFPMSPPTASAQLDNGGPGPYATSDDDDDLPTIENLLAKTRPPISTPTKKQKTGSAPSSQPTESPTPQKPDIPRTPTSKGTLRSSTPGPSTSTHPQSQPPLSRRPKPRPKRKRADVDADGSPPTQTPSASASASAKRQKTKQPSQFRKHSTYWLLDGNVLLQIENYRLKLHRSRLAKLSPLFTRLFEPQGDVEEIEENPVYHLDKYGVELQDFEVLLDAMDDAITFYYSPPSFSTVASILRASTALSFPVFSEWSTRYLEELFPSVLEHTSLVKRIPCATEAVVLARNCDVAKVLKRAMYELVRTEGFGQDTEDADAGVLSQADYRALLKAREKLTSFWLLTAASPSTSFSCPLAAPDGGAPPPPNPSAHPCPTAHPSLSVEKHAKLVHASGVFEEYLFDPVCGMQVLMDAPWAGEGYCAGCVATRREAWGKAREKVWRNLSIWFGLEEEED